MFSLQDFVAAHRAFEKCTTCHVQDQKIREQARAVREQRCLNRKLQAEVDALHEGVRRAAKQAEYTDRFA